MGTIRKNSRVIFFKLMKNSSFVSILHQQFSEVIEGGFPVLYRKTMTATKLLMRKLFFIPGLIATSPIVLLISLIRPIVLVRFGTFETSRIGHFSIEPELYLSELELELAPERCVDLFGCPEPVCNQHLRLMWARTLRIIPCWLSVILDQSCLFWTRGVIHHIEISSMGRDIRQILKSQPHLSFTEEEKRRGQILLEKLGIPKGSPWICIHNRDSAYLNQKLSGQWRYHNYRDFNIGSMTRAAEELAKRGYFVLRIGSIQAEAFSIANRKVIDYASSPHRSEFGDIYLSSGCSAYMGSDSGIAQLPLIFGKPVCFVNYSLAGADLFPRQGCYPSPAFIVKHLFHKEKQRFLSIQEMFDLGLYNNAFHSHKFEDAGVELIANTPEEIQELAIEIDERLKGLWKFHPEDAALQRQFWDIFRKNDSAIDKRDIASIGSAFLRQHQYLLD